MAAAYPPRDSCKSVLVEEAQFSNWDTHQRVGMYTLNASRLTPQFSGRLSWVFKERAVFVPTLPTDPLPAGRAQEPMAQRWPPYFSRKNKHSEMFVLEVDFMRGLVGQSHLTRKVN